MQVPAFLLRQSRRFDRYTAAKLFSTFSQLKLCANDQRNMV